MEVFTVFLANSLKYYFECDDAYLLKNIFSDAKIQALQDGQSTETVVAAEQPRQVSATCSAVHILTAAFWACGLRKEELADAKQARIVFLCLGFRGAQLAEKVGELPVGGGASYSMDSFLGVIKEANLQSQMKVNFIKLRRVFVDIDVSKTGMVSFTTFRGALQQLGATVGLSISTDLQCRIWVQLVDHTSTNGTGSMLSTRSPYGGGGMQKPNNTKGFTVPWLDVSGAH
jgi:hypothetical protein